MRRAGGARAVSIVGAALLLPTAVHGETLSDALLQAYKTNPTITAARASLRATDETVPIARAAGLPSVSLTSGFTQNVLSSSNTFAEPPKQLSANGGVSLPIFSGGAVRNAVAAAKTRVEAGRAGLSGTESDLFTAVVGAYMDVIRDEAIVGLNQQNVHVLDVNLQATKDRFQVGDVTRTDIAQSQARLALAQSQLETAQSNLIASRENFVRLVGTPPGKLEPPPALPDLPDAPDTAVRTALQDNPALLSAQKSAAASVYDVGVARAERLPQVALTAGGNYINDLGSLGSGTDISVGQSGAGATAGVSFSVPLFQGGRASADIRRAQDLHGQAIEQQTETERAVVAQTRSAFAAWRASQQMIQSSQVAVDADKLSLEGVRAENSVGNRTILDILNAEQELVNAQVDLVTAKHDAYVAGFALLAAMGDAQAKNLGLGGGALYDPVAHYNHVRHDISDFDLGHAPQPIAAGTADVPAQGSDVDPSLVPSLDSSLGQPVDSAPPNATGDVKKDR